MANITHFYVKNRSGDSVMLRYTITFLLWFSDDIFMILYIPIGSRTFKADKQTLLKQLEKNCDNLLTRLWTGCIWNLFDVLL